MNSTVKNRNVVGKGGFPRSLVNGYYHTFDGIDEYIICGKPFQPTNLQNFSISFWANINTMAATKTIVAYSSNHNGLAVFTYNGMIRIRIGGSGFLIDKSLPIGWNHISFSIDRTNILGYGVNKVILYLNGVYDSNASTGAAVMQYGSYLFTIGQHSSYAGLLYDKWLDELAYFSKALTLAEITTLMGTRTNPGNAKSIGDCEGWWRFEQKYSDESGKGFNGTAYNCDSSNFVAL